MAKLIRSMLVAASAAFLFAILPAVASAQNVHEVRPAGVDHVRIGVHGPASIDEIVALARRITGNPALTADDVIANLPHTRRYACRAGGRLVYFGPDPEYGGRCPEHGIRREGVLRGATYRIPREHGVVLEPPVERRARPSRGASAPNPADAARLTEVERRLTETAGRLRLAEQSATDAGTARIRAEAEASRLRDDLATARRERDEARAALAARPTAPIVVSVPGLRETAERETITLASRLHGMPIWGLMALLALVILAVAFIAFGLVVLPREKRPLVDRIDELEEAKTKTEGELMEKRVEADEASKDLAKARRRIESLRAAGTRVIRMGKRLFEESRASAEAHRVLKEDEERAAAKLIAYQNRKQCIAENHAKLMQLREEEDPFLHLETLIRQTETDRELAVEREDMDAVTQYDQALAIYRENLESLGDSNELRARIAGLTTVLARDVRLQCGFAFDTRSVDDRLVHWEDLRREELREAAAARKNYETLVSLLEERELGRVAEITSKRRALEGEVAAKEGELAGRHWCYASARYDAEEALRAKERELTELREVREALDEHKRLVDAFAGDPSAHAQAILQRDALIADLAQKLREVGIDPGRLPATPSNGSWPEEITEELPLPGTPAYGVCAPRKRVPTLAVGASEEAVKAARDSQLPAPPKSPTYSLNRAVCKLLDDLESLPPDARIVPCDEREAADWVQLFGTCQISAPRLGIVPFRKLLAAAASGAPEWLSGRMTRQRTEPPPAPSTA